MIMKSKKSLFSLVTGFVSWSAIIVFGLLIGLTFLSNFNFGKYRTFIIQSGSMEPSIMTGDVIIIKSERNYFKNDVVTFKGNKGRVATHRIVDIEDNQDKREFITKGDANRDEDNDKINIDQILGKVILTIPKFGYIISFGRSRLGIGLLLVIPGGLILIDEIKNIKSNLKSES
jgi:signal peptidase I